MVVRVEMVVMKKNKRGDGDDGVVMLMKIALENVVELSPEMSPEWSSEGLSER